MDPLGTSDVALLVGMVKTGGRSGKWWAMKARAIIALATFTDGTWFGAPDVELLTGIPAPLARRILLELEQQHVIDRDGGHVARPQVFWCEVNPDWRRWEVEWSMSAREIETRLAYAGAKRAVQPLDRLFARPAGARFHRVRALLSARAFDRERALWTLQSARQQGAQRDPLARATGARKWPSHRQEVSLLAEADEHTSSSLDRAQEEEGKSHQQWGRVRATYARRVGDPALWGEPAARLARLVAAYGPDRVLEGIERAPEGLGRRLLGEELERMLALAPDEAEAELATVTPLVDDATRRARVHNLEQMVATWRADGAEPPEELLAELARWQYGAEVGEEA